MNEKRPMTSDRTYSPEEARFLLKWAVIYPFIAISTAVAVAEVIARLNLFK